MKNQTKTTNTTKTNNYCRTCGGDYPKCKDKCTK